MAEVKWINVRDAYEMYFSCKCGECNSERDLNVDPSACPECGCSDICVSPGAVKDLICGRTRNLVCSGCSEDLSASMVNMYPHDNGWKMPGVDGKWWMFIECPYCNHGNSFQTFGIPKN
jgi:hypothetical protein